MFNASINSLAAGQVRRLSFFADQEPLCFSTVFQYWQSDEVFRRFFISHLRDAPFAAYFWEMPPLTRQMLQRPFECVLVESPQLVDVQADAACFADYFSVDETVVDFANLGGDAWLVAPCPQGGSNNYPHLAAFSRQAPMVQQQALWQRVGHLVDERMGDQPLWLSTSGLGVSWLHIRLDRIPKYYSYRPYRDMSSEIKGGTNG